MEATPYLVLIAALSLAILSPGPAVIAASQTAMSQGRGPAMRYGLGLAAGASLWCLFALLGLAVIFQTSPMLFAALKLAGGVYLLWMAQALWRKARLPLPEIPSATTARPSLNFARSFAGGIVLNLSNPKPALFYSALILSIFPDPLDAGQRAGIYLASLSTEVFWYAALVLAMSTTLMRTRYLAGKFWIDRSAALALAGLGCLLIVQP